jgi:membrane-bound serine protease (ClpP class)
MVAVLPVFGINIPLWGIVAVLVAFAVFSYFMYRIGHPTILYDGVTGPDSIVGKEGVVEADINPAGYVRVEGELWKAASSSHGLRKGDTVIVTGISGLELIVERKS